MLTRLRFAPSAAWFAALAALAACGACASSSPPAARSVAATPASATTAPSVSPVAAAAKTTLDSLAVDGDPNGLFWNAATDTLLVADETGNRVLAWNESAGWSTAFALPKSAAKSPGLGQPVQLADGTIVVPRFGFGTDGDVVIHRPDGSISTVPHLDKARRRIGLAVGSDGALYDAYFVKRETTKSGGVARLDLGSGETDLVSDLKKPVGVLAAPNGTALWVSDQDAGTLIAIALPGKSETVVASAGTLDLLSTGPDGAIFTGGRDGAVRRIDAQGHVTLFANGFSEVRGVAYDPKGRRLFFVEHVASNATGKKSALFIRPVP